MLYRRWEVTPPSASQKKNNNNNQDLFKHLRFGYFCIFVFYIFLSIFCVVPAELRIAREHLLWRESAQCFKCNSVFRKSHMSCNSMPGTSASNRKLVVMLSIGLSSNPPPNVPFIPIYLKLHILGLKGC